MHAIRVVARGDALLGPATTRQVVAAWVRRPPWCPPRARNAAHLGAREQAVVERVAAGRNQRRDRRRAVRDGIHR